MSFVVRLVMAGVSAVGPILDTVILLRMYPGATKMNQPRPFDASKYLTDEETISEFLTASLEDENPDVFLRALAEVAKAHGMSQLARDSGMGRESLYKALAPGAKPRYDTVLKLLNALGVKLTVQRP